MYVWSAVYNKAYLIGYTRTSIGLWMNSFSPKIKVDKSQFWSNYVPITYTWGSAYSIAYLVGGYTRMPIVVWVNSISPKEKNGQVSILIKLRPNYTCIKFRLQHGVFGRRLYSYVIRLMNEQYLRLSPKVKVDKSQFWSNYVLITYAWGSAYNIAYLVGGYTRTPIVI